jgi:hypothetical protein
MIQALQDSAVTVWLNSLLWGFPGAEIFHIVMTGGFFGGIVMLDLRLLGVHKRIASTLLMQHILPCLWWLFAGVVASGALLFLYMPVEYFYNPVFRIKLVLIALGGLNALVMHVALLRSQFVWDSHNSVPMGVRLSALVSLATWIGVLACGRLIAYFYGA